MYDNLEMASEYKVFLTTRVLNKLVITLTGGTQDTVFFLKNIQPSIVAVF